jgi:hypothetical protein
MSSSALGLPMFIYSRMTYSRIALNAVSESYRPNGPKKPRKVCFQCAMKAVEAKVDAGEEVQFITKQIALDEAEEKFGNITGQTEN